MPAREDCPGNDHRAPVEGGSCPCGMVTRIPAAQPSPRIDVRDVLALCLYDGPGDPLTADDPRRADVSMSSLLRQRADQVLAALADAGLVVAPGAQLRRSA